MRWLMLSKICFYLKKSTKKFFNLYIIIMEFKNNKLSNIWKMLFSEESVVEEKEEVVEVSEEKSEFLDATLESGVAIQIEPALEIGAAVISVDAEGVSSAVEDATHILSDGTSIVTVEGVITEIIPAEEEEGSEQEEEEVAEEVATEAVEEEMAEEAEETQEQKVKKIVESIVRESHFAKEESLEDVKEAFKAEITQLKEAMFKAFEEFGKTEEKAPTKKPAKFKREVKGSWVDKLSK